MSSQTISQELNVYIFDNVYQVVAPNKKAASELVYEDLDIKIRTKDIQKRIRFLKKVL